MRMNEEVKATGLKEYIVDHDDSLPEDEDNELFVYQWYWGEPDKDYQWFLDNTTEEERKHAYEYFKKEGMSFYDKFTWFNTGKRYGEGLDEACGKKRGKRMKKLNERMMGQGEFEEIYYDILDRARDYVKEGDDKNDAVYSAIDEVLMWNDDKWPVIMNYFNPDDISEYDEAVNQLANDISAELGDGYFGESLKENKLSEDEEAIKEAIDIISDTIKHPLDSDNTVNKVEDFKEDPSEDTLKEIVKQLFRLEIGFFSYIPDRFCEDPEEPTMREQLSYYNYLEKTYDKPISKAILSEYNIFEESLNEDTVKTKKGWVNKGKEGTHGTFKTKKAADAQRKAMFASGYKGESLNQLTFKKTHSHRR